MRGKELTPATMTHNWKGIPKILNFTLMSEGTMPHITHPNILVWYQKDEPPTCPVLKVNKINSRGTIKL